VIAAILGIAMVEIVALCKGKNGFILRMVIAILAALGGLTLGTIWRIIH
jgi:hypothetical protein